MKVSTPASIVVQAIALAMTLDLGVLAAKDCVCHNVPGAPTTFDASATQDTCQTYHDRAAKVGAVNAIEVRDGK
ncbi:MAG: hypothetical protein M4579_007394, partial [Chaenotheca gracillima]